MPRYLLPGLLFSALSLTACGGGGGSFGGTDPGIDPPISNPTNIAGVWKGTADFGDVTDTPVFLFTTADGSLRLVGLEFATQARGDIDLPIDDNLNGSASFAANVTVFESQDFFLGTSIVTENCALTADITEASSLSGRYLCQDALNQTGEFITEYAALNATDAAFPVVSGTWTAANESFSFTVDDQGNITDGAFIKDGATTCSVTGSATPIEGENLYRLVFILSEGNCGVLTGTYSGLGTIAEIADAPDRFILQADNNELIFSYQLFSNQ
jgi:hypothetical protein